MQQAEQSAAILFERLCGRPDRTEQVPSCVVVAAHPDDEVIGLGAQLPRLGQARLVHVTDGAPRDGRDARAHGFDSVAAYAWARRRELDRAVALAGIGPDRLHEMGCPDQQASTRLAALAHQVSELLCAWSPELVITHPYEGGHPDHDATAFAVHAACRLLRQAGKAAPVMVEMSSYHLGPQGLEMGCFLAGNTGHRGRPSAVLQLSGPQRALKRRMLACFASQGETLGNFPVETECLRVAPAYDFGRRPHEGKLFYERFPWGMTGARLSARATEAAGALGIEGVL